MRRNNSYDDEYGASFNMKKRESVTPIRELKQRQKWIIYPENKYIRHWDALMLTLILLYSFIVPYQLGVSGGSHLIRKPAWFYVTVLMNTCFLIDTFLPFIRAYRDFITGRMVMEPKTLRRNYLRSFFWPNLISNIPTTIAFFWYGEDILSDASQSGSFFTANTRPLLNILRTSDILKLLRLGRARRLLVRSEFVRQLGEKRKPSTIRLWIFCLSLVVAAHWFACIWSMVAFVQVGSFEVSAMQREPNWIFHWYEGNYVEGGLDPLGWDQDVERYVLSLFWACQTITSIGYGNIAPLTVAEWWIAAILQLVAGIIWAYVIGNLVGVVTAMEVRNELVRERIDQANTLINAFLPEEQEDRGVFPLFRKSPPTTRYDSHHFARSQDIGKTMERDDDATGGSNGGANAAKDNKDNNNNTGSRHSNFSTGNLIPKRRRRKNRGSLAERKQVAKRIRKYIYTQNERRRSTFRFQCLIQDKYPVLKSLSPELQRTSTLMVVQQYLQKVPYLSSRYLSWHEQSLVAQQCSILEFPAEEIFRMGPADEDDDQTNTNNNNAGGDGFNFNSNSVCSGNGSYGNYSNNLGNKSYERYGRGIIIQMSGVLWRSSILKGEMPMLFEGVVGIESVLLEDEQVILPDFDDDNDSTSSKRRKNRKHSAYVDEDVVALVSFSQLLYIPRDAVLTALARNPRAWNECARWKYVAAGIVQQAKHRIRYS